MSADRLVRVAPDEKTLPVGDHVLRASRAVHALRAAVANDQHHEYLRLKHALPEGAELLPSGDRHQVGVKRAHRVDRARQEIGRLLRVGVGEHQNVAMRDARAGRARPLFPEPAGRQGRALENAEPRVGARYRTRDLTRAVVGVIVDE